MNNIILVHIGDLFYDYINDCIEQILIFNENCELYLIISSIHNDKIINKNIKLINIENIKKTEKHLFFQNNSQLNTTFRGGFWKFATERFFYIEDLMIQYELKNVFHVESDVLIYFDFNDYLSIFDEKYKIAAVFDNDDRCIPSIMYFKNINYISDLNDFINKNKYLNDMEVISLYKKNSNIIDSLPIIPSSYKEIKTFNGKTSNNPDKFYNNYELFNSIFDGACIGQFIGGIDPIHADGGSSGFINKDSLLIPSNFEYIWEIQNNKKILFAMYNGEKIKINNLHVHCKNLKKFKS